MRYLPIDNKLFIQNRKNFSKQLKSNGLAIFNANDIMPTNADGTFPFRQNNDLFYLSGIDQEETVMVLFPDSKNGKHAEILFVKETNEHIAIWQGNKLTKEEATKVSGIKTVYWLSQLESILPSLIAEAEYLYVNKNEHARAEKAVETRDDRYIKTLRKKYPLHKYERTAPIVENLRMIKSATEVELIKTACGITEKAFRKILPFIKPGVMEYEIEAEILHEFIRNRSRGPAYESIIASGFNACVLHYVDNNKECKKGDVILMDFGAEYANYASDMTRSVPVSGRFTKRQKEVYNAVLTVMREATKMLKAGNNYNDYNKAVGEIMEKELIGLGLLKLSEVKKQNKEQPLYKKYFMHGTSHFLGLDVHDVGNRYSIFKEGMIFTCEPGIYIREENLGIRLENDIFITSSKPMDLMKNIPVEADEIEDLMNR